MDFELEAIFELPSRHVLSLVGPSLSDGLLSYANASQTAPTTQGSATSSPLYTQGLSTVAGTAQAARPSTGVVAPRIGACLPKLLDGWRPRRG